MYLSADATIDKSQWNVVKNICSFFDTTDSKSDPAVAATFTQESVTLAGVPTETIVVRRRGQLRCHLYATVPITPGASYNGSYRLMLTRYQVDRNGVSVCEGGESVELVASSNSVATDVVQGDAFIELAPFDPLGFVAVTVRFLERLVGCNNVPANYAVKGYQAAVNDGTHVTFTAH